MFAVRGNVRDARGRGNDNGEKLMNRAYIWTIGLLALLLMSVHARAGAPNFTLAQTATPITRTYPGVDASILGIRTGMTLSEAEAIAKKNYPKETPSPASSLFLFFTGGKLQTKPLVPSLEFSKQTASSSDRLTLHFTTPAAGNTIYAVSRNIDFDGTPGKAARFPPMDAVKASLIKKYGPPSYQERFGLNRPYGPGLGTGLMLAWVFNKNSRLNCQSRDCVGPMFPGESDLLGSSKPQYDKFLQKTCGASADSSAVFKIVAKIYASGLNANRIVISMGDIQACVNDGEQVWNQFNAAVAKLTKPKLKLQASLPGASESVPPGSGPFSFYGDIGGVIGPDSQNTLLVRPSTLYLTEDGSAALTHLQWSDWGKGIARATGLWSASDCTPDCAQGKVTTRPARLTLWSPGRVEGHWVYRCFLIDPQHPKRDPLDRACIRGQEYSSLPK